MAIDSFREYMDTLSILVETENLYASIEELIRKSNKVSSKWTDSILDNISELKKELKEEILRTSKEYLKSEGTIVSKPYDLLRQESVCNSTMKAYPFLVYQRRDNTYFVGSDDDPITSDVRFIARFRNYDEAKDWMYDNSIISFDSYTQLYCPMEDVSDFREFVAKEYPTFPKLEISEWNKLFNSYGMEDCLDK